MSIADLVKDWGGFEKLVEKLHETGQVTVERNVFLQGRSGAPRQIDVLVRHKQGLYEHLVVAECKYWNSPVERLHVDALATTIREVGASRGVIFSTKGFQSGAVTQAAHDNIDLFTVRDLTAEEWGLPGRVIDFYLQVIQPSIGQPVIHGATAVAMPGTNVKPIALNLSYGPDGPLSATPILALDGSKSVLLEERMADAAQKALGIFMSDGFTINGGTECTRYMLGKVNLEPKEPFSVPIDNVIVRIPKISFDLGIKISQSRIKHDRAEKLMFALAIENCINGSISAASRPIDAQHTTLSDIVPVKAAPEDKVVANGSVMRVFIKGFFPFEEMSGLEPIPIESVRRSRGFAGDG
ncbi:MAG: restriction endonuclease [Methylocella sp.]